MEYMNKKISFSFLLMAGIYNPYKPEEVSDRIKKTAIVEEIFTKPKHIPAGDYISLLL